MGDDTAHWEDVGKIPAQGVPQSDRTATLEGEVWEVDVSITGGISGGGGLQEVDTYSYFCQNTFTQFIVTRPIMELCTTEERSNVSWLTKRWWEHRVLELEGMRTADQEAEREEEKEEMDGMETETDD